MARYSRATQRAQGCAYATYIGVWKSRMRVTKGARSIGRYEDPITHTKRSFCLHCGTPLIYERRGKMLNLPRALFDGRTGREPRYHRHKEEAPDWAYREEPLKPLKGYPGILWTGAKRRKRRETLLNQSIKRRGMSPHSRPRRHACVAAQPSVC